MTFKARLTFRDGLFLGFSDFDARHLFQDAQFRWDQTQKVWYTKHSRIAVRLRDYADRAALREIDRHFIKNSPWDTAIPYPRNLTPYSFQIDRAVPFALARNRSYLALDPGCGKTICAILYLNALFSAGYIDKALYVCPPFLMENVSAEFERWATFDFKLARFSQHKWRNEYFAANVVLMPDSLLTVIKETKQFNPRAANFLKDWLTVSAGALIVDEAHRFKNDTSQRSLALYEGVMPFFDNVVFMSGTPMPNRPMELYPVLHYAAPETIDFRTRFEYGLKYCGAHRTRFGWKYDGASNQSELMHNIKQKFLLRIKKSEVLSDLPAKIESIVFLEANYPPKLVDLDSHLLSRYSPKDLIKHQFDDPHVATYRRELGAHKADKAVEFIKGILEDSGESLLVFAHHKEVVSVLTEGLAKYNPLVIAGHTPSHVRAERAKEFQENQKRRVLILNIQAGGIGFNLTKASRVIMVEYSWVPAENEQAIDRAHRIGQKNSVFAQYLVWRNSLDAKIMHAVLRKQKVTGAL